MTDDNTDDAFALLAARALAARALANTIHTVLLHGERVPELAPLALYPTMAGLLGALIDAAGQVEEAADLMDNAVRLGRLRWVPAEAEEAPIGTRQDPAT